MYASSVASCSMVLRRVVLNLMTDFNSKAPMTNAYSIAVACKYTVKSKLELFYRHLHILYEYSFLSR